MRGFGPWHRRSGGDARRASNREKFRLSLAEYAAAGLNGTGSGEQRNSAKGRRPAGTISDADRSVIEEHNALDMELSRRVAEIAPR